MPTPSDNHGFDLNYEQGEEGWSYNEEFEHLEERVPVVDDENVRADYTPHENAIYIAADTHSVALGDGSMWDEIGEIVDPSQFAAADHDHDGEYNNYTFSESHDDLSDVGANDHHEAFEPDDYTPVADVDGANIDIAGNAATATSADEATLWDGVEVVLNDETPQTDTYLRIETVN